MSANDVVFEEKSHYWPFIVDYAFDDRDDTFCMERLQHLVSDFLARHIRKEAEKKPTAEVLESLIKMIGVGCSGKDIFGTGSNFSAVVDRLRQGDNVDLAIGLANVRLNLNRFGSCVGIRALDDRGNLHVNATEIFERMASLCAEDGGSNYLGRFVRSRSVIAPRWQAYKGNTICVASELASVARYVPDVQWRVDAEAVVDALCKDYIATDRQYGDVDLCGVEVGQYHEIPVYAQILFGGKDSSTVWRRGSVSREGVVLKFDSNSGDHPSVRYFVRVGGENNMFKKATPGIDYMQEQECHGWLSDILKNALSARHLAETIASNPSWVKWKEKAPEKLVPVEVY